MPQKLSLPQYKREGSLNYPVRKVKYENCPNLIQHDPYKLLIYASQMLSIFDLEYTMLRNFSNSWQTQQLEDRTQSGRPFWPEIEAKKKKLNARSMEEHCLDD